MNNTKNSTPKAFRHGLQSFNQRAFYEAHEYFEAAWRQTSGEEREFFRAFLHLSGGFFRLAQDRPGAAKKFFNHARKWLSDFPEDHLGFNVTQLKKYIQQLISFIDQQVPTDKIIAEQHQPIQPREGLIR